MKLNQKPGLNMETVQQQNRESLPTMSGLAPKQRPCIAAVALTGYNPSVDTWPNTHLFSGIAEALGPFEVGL